MADPFAFITEASDEVLEDIVKVLELRGADPQQHEIVRTYLGDITFPPNARALEIGCGTGAVTRMLAQWPNVAQALGVDLSPVLIEKARRFSADLHNLQFEPGDACRLGEPDSTFDVAVFHTLLSHCPSPGLALQEAKRVLKPGGWLAICDADFCSVTVAQSNHDPLQACTNAFVEGFVHDKWMARHLQSVVADAGLRIGTLRSHGYVDNSATGLFSNWVRRGADFLQANGRIGGELSEALKAELLRRARAGTFFGQLSYISVTAQKPL